MVRAAFYFLFSLPSFPGADLPEAAPAVPPAPEEETIWIQTGRSYPYATPWPVKQVSVADPKVADIQVVAKDQILIIGKTNGTTVVTLWSETDETLQVRVEVDNELDRISGDIKSLFSGSKIEVIRSRDLLIVKGLLARTEHAEQLHRYLEGLKEAQKIKYIDLTSVAGIQQVQIQVRLAEVSRVAIRALGINGYHAGEHFFGASTVGSSAGGALQPVSMGAAEGASAASSIPARGGAAGLPFIFNNDINVNPLVTLFGGFPDVNLQIFFQALAENQYLRVLAEPTLVALSGEEATFLAGGEYPIPVIQGSLSTSNSITIEYKEFGVRLRFRPTVLGDGAIRLLVSPEVSDLSDVGAVEIQGFRIPSLLTRKAETTLELHSGQTFAMAGLLNRTDAARSSRVPFLGGLPIIGALFRSVRYQQGDTELVVLVTASLVEPLSAGQVPPVPGDLHAVPNDWELYGLGRIVGKGNTRPLPPLPPVRELGLEKLRGPGAWAGYDGPGSGSRSTLKPGAGQ